MSFKITEIILTYIYRKLNDLLILIQKAQIHAHGQIFFLYIKFECQNWYLTLEIIKDRL